MGMSFLNLSNEVGAAPPPQPGSSDPFTVDRVHLSC